MVTICVQAAGATLAHRLGDPPYHHILPCWYNTAPETDDKKHSWNPIIDYMCIIHCWLVVSTNPSEKYGFVSWDDDIPNIWKVIKAMFQTTNQIVIFHHMSKRQDPGRKIPTLSHLLSLKLISHRFHV